jgi:hypothetical protein
VCAGFVEKSRAVTTMSATGCGSSASTVMSMRESILYVPPATGVGGWEVEPPPPLLSSSDEE